MTLNVANRVVGVAGGPSISLPAADLLAFKHNKGFAENENIHDGFAMRRSWWCRRSDHADWL